MTDSPSETPEGRPVSPLLADIVERMITVLRTGSPHERIVTASALGRLRWNAAKAVPELIELQRRDPKTRPTVVEAIGAIGRSAAQAAIPFLTAVLLDQSAAADFSDRSAARALGRTDDRLAVEPLKRALSQAAPDSAIQYDIIDSLSELGPLASETVPLLVKHLDPDSGLLGPAVTALASIGPEARAAVPRLEYLLQQPLDVDLRRRIQEAIQRIGERN